MKLISQAIIITLVMVSMLFVMGIKVEGKQHQNHLGRYYQKVLRLSIEDAGQEMIKASFHYEQGFKPVTYEGAKQVIEQFFETFTYNIGASSPQNRLYMHHYFPVILILDRDGYYAYVLGRQKTTNGEEITPKLEGKRYYSYYEDENNYFHLTLGKVYTHFTFDGQTWHQAEYPYDQLDPSQHHFFQQQIVEEIEGVLTRAIRSHQDLLGDKGARFQVDLVSQDNSWKRAVDEGGLIVMMQGLPLGGGAYIKQMSSERIALSPHELLVGYTENQVKYYAKYTCQEAQDKGVEALFLHGSEAAKEGYFPCHTCYP